MCDFCECRNEVRYVNSNGCLNITNKEVLWKHHEESPDDITEITTPYGTLVFSGMEYCPVCGERLSQ